MAMLGAALMGKVVGHSDAEKAFRPWWDQTADYIMYSLAMTSVVLLPTSIFSSASIDCTLEQASDTLPTGPKLDLKFVKMTCLMNEVDWFVLHFPYILLLATIVLFAIEKVSMKINDGNVIQKKFYKVLSDYNVFGKTADNEGDMVDAGLSGEELEARRDIVDLKAQLQDSSSYFWTYLVTQVLEFTFSLLFAGLMISKVVLARGFGLDPTLHCLLYGFRFECHGHPAAFYTVVIAVTSAILLTYALTTLYSIFWVSCPSLHILNKLKIFSDSSKASKDLRFLLNMLGQGAGIGPAVIAITLLDNDFCRSVQPQEVQLKLHGQGLAGPTEPGQGASLTVELQEPTSSTLSRLREIAKVCYTVELRLTDATTATSAVELLRPCKTGYQSSKAVSNRGRATFSCLREASDYTLTVSTLVDGRTVGAVQQGCNTARMEGEVEMVGMDILVRGDYPDKRVD